MRFGGGETSPHFICIPSPVSSAIKDFPVLYSTPAIVDMKVGIHTVCPLNLSSLESRVTEYDPNPCEPILPVYTRGDSLSVRLV